MNGDELLEKFGLIDQKFIEEAETEKTKKNIRTPILIAACFMLVLLAAVLPFLKEEAPEPMPPVTEDTEEADINYPAPTVYEDGVLYSVLEISDNGLEPEILDIKGGSAEIDGFDEQRYVANAEMVIEGRVKDVRVKHYEIITDFDKFGDGGRTHFFEDSVVYEIEVEKVYKGEVSIGGTFVIEDRVIAPRSTFYLKEGHRYVIPLVQAEEDWGSWHGNIIEGSTERDSMFYNPYRYHPQIERTEDGYYLFSDDWETLASSEKAVRVTMDVPFDYGYQDYFNDKMMLLDSSTFEEKMKLLLERYN